MASARQPDLSGGWHAGHAAIEIGQQVAAGEVLATLYNPQLEPARDAARARLAELQAQSAQGAT
ncbi:hypothetical protein ULG90_05840 [Halopseudomonas pachastrellae]|nr:hypothetical protein ULG90_05840 [Halopseudomonas pachastrellae]